MTYYKHLNFPAVPKNLISLDIHNPDYYTPLISVPVFNYGNDHYLDGQLIEPPGYFMYSVNYQPLVDWLLEFIPAYNQQNSLWLIITKHANQGRMIVHTDISRKFVVNYIIDPGGDQVSTNWWREIGHSLIRGKKDPGQQTDTGHVKYDNLELLESVVCEKNNWYMTQTNVLHDVSNINSPRIFLSFSIDEPK